MKGSVLLTAIVLASCLFHGCQATAEQTVAQVNVEAPLNDGIVTTPAAPTCTQTTGAIQGQCADMAAQILAVTVQIHVGRWAKGAGGGKGEYLNGGVGHGTVKDGRYVVTHNHFSVPLASVADTELVQLTVTDWQGKTILQEMPLSAIHVVAVDSETLVLDFGQVGETGLLAMLGLASAQFGSYDSRSLQAGMEVAQIDWDGVSAHVDWVTVEAVSIVDGVPQIRVANGLMAGASGGGVFLDGIHVANNWFTASVSDNSGALLYQYSVAAINPGRTLAQGN